MGVFYSATPATAVIVADVPIDMPQLVTQSNVVKTVFAENMAAVGYVGNSSTEHEVNKSARYDGNIAQEDLRLFTLNFLDFSKHLNYNGTICNGDVCCIYDIDVNDNGSHDKKVNIRIK